MAEKQSTALVTKDIHALLDRRDVQLELRKALPKHLTPERLIRLAATTIQKSPKLKLCTPLSLLSCVIECAQLGLEPDNVLGEIYLVPFADQATIIVGWKGFAKLAYQTGDIYKITTFVVRRGEPFHQVGGSSPLLEHVPKDHGDEQDDSTWTHAYAIAFYRDGHTDWQVLERAEVFRRRSRSRAWTSKKMDSPWFTDPEAMWKKSAVRALATRLPKSTTDNRLARAAALDELGEQGLLTPTTTGFEIAETAATDDGGPADPGILQPIQQSKEIPADGGTGPSTPAGKKTKSKKKGAAPPATGSAVPKAQIPRDPIDVTPTSVKTEQPKNPKNDPQITRAQYAEIYQKGADSGSWNVDTIREWVRKKFGCNVSELRVSQLPEVMRVMTSGT